MLRAGFNIMEAITRLTSDLRCGLQSSRSFLRGSQYAHENWYLLHGTCSLLRSTGIYCRCWYVEVDTPTIKYNCQEKGELGNESKENCSASGRYRHDFLHERVCQEMCQRLRKSGESRVLGRYVWLLLRLLAGTERLPCQSLKKWFKAIPQRLCKQCAGRAESPAPTEIKMRLHWPTPHKKTHAVKGRFCTDIFVALTCHASACLRHRALIPHKICPFPVRSSFANEYLR